MKKSDIYKRLCAIRDTTRESAGPTTPGILVTGIITVKIEGYLMALRDFNIITKKEFEGMLREWCDIK